LIKCGEYEVTDFSKKLLPWVGRMIEEVDPADTMLKRGEKMFQDKKLAKIYYGEWMKSIQIWSECMGADFTKLYSKLKDTKKYEFPMVSPEEMKQFRKDFDYNMQKNEVKNEALSEIKQDEQQNSSKMSQRLKSQQSSTVLHPSLPPIKPPLPMSDRFIALHKMIDYIKLAKA
jgi:hypothetical protein